MSEDKERMYRIALKALLLEAEHGADLDEFCEGAIASMLDDIAYDSDDIAQAVIAIEVAADAVSH